MLPFATLQLPSYLTTSVKCKISAEELLCQQQYSLRKYNSLVQSHFMTQNVQYFHTIFNICLQSELKGTGETGY